MPSETEFQPPDGQDLARFAGMSVPDSEAYLYLAMLNALADSRFPPDELRRYVRLRYGLSESDFDEVLSNFEDRARNARDAWVEKARSEVERRLTSEHFALAGMDLNFEPLAFRCELTLEVGPAIAERQALFDLVVSLKLVAATLSVPVNGRPVGARLMDIAVFQRPDGAGYGHVLRVTISGEKAREILTATPRDWLASSQARLSPNANDLLVRFLKPKLAALRLANGGLNAANRFLGHRK